MSLILNVRGTNGSGKSYISKKLRDDHYHELVVEPKTILGKNFKKPNATIVPTVGADVILVGREKTSCDGIFPQEIIEDMLRYWAGRGHCVWDNVLVSGNVGRWGVLAEEFMKIGHKNIWAPLDTPYATCIERIYARRAQAEAEGFKHRQKSGTIKEDVVRSHWRRCRRSPARAIMAHPNIEIRWIDHTRSYEQVHDILVEHGWSPPEGFLLEPELRAVPWQPTEEDLEYIIKTAMLPWLDEKPEERRRPARKDTITTDLVTASQVSAPGSESPVALVPEREALDDPFIDVSSMFS
jgi:adenylate kinase family enzyme